MDMSKAENIKVQRENHFDELMTKLKGFARAGIITDLALVTGGEPLHMHHIILSCFSSCFEYLTENEYIKYLVHTDQRKTVLEALIDYIYKGIAYIPQIYKKQLVMAATSLHIRDFSTMNNDFDHLSNKEQATIVCPNHKVQLSLKIWNARQNASNSDVIFIINNRDRVFAHACILGACSSHLLQIFTEHCAKKRKPFIVALRNIKKADLELVLEFCYKGEVSISFNDVQSVYNIADLLGVETLCKLLNEQCVNLVQTLPAKDEKYSSNMIRTSEKPTALADLLKYERLVDVFIFTKQKIFKAHSVILSIYSVFFKELANFLNYDMKGIIILIENVNTSHVEALLEYMYIGETKFEGSVEEFCKIMAEWIDLNILPVSSDIVPPVLSSIQSSIEDCECKINSAVNNDTLSNNKNERRYIENDKDTNVENVDETLKNDEISDLRKENTLLRQEDESATNNVSIEIGITSENRDRPNIKKSDVTDCADSTSKFAEVEENCDRTSQYNEISATKMNCIPDKSIQDEVEMMSEMVELESGNSVEKECISIEEDNHETMKNESASSRKHNLQGISHKSFVTRSKFKTESSKQCKKNINQNYEQEDNLADAPKKQKTINTNDCIDDTISSASNDCIDDTINKKDKSRVFECQICKETFTMRWEFKLHLSEHPRGNVLQCKFCQKEFNRPNELQSHLRSHTGARPLQCEVCGMSFMSKNTLKKHEHIHSKNKKNEFECEICEKTFSRKQYLHEHRRTHSGSKPYECDVCHKRFVGKTGLNHHKRVHRNAEEKKCVVCEICGESFSRHALWTHMKHHNKQHKCEFCNKSFATSAALKIHESGIHLGCTSQHHCDTCGKGFMQKGHLSRHLKTHEKENNIVMFTCDQCPSKFKDKSHLKTHVKRKHAEQSNRSQSCGICGKHFSTQSTLIYHQRLHFHERPHRCNLCGKTFAMPYQLRDHTRLHHSDEKLFPCSVCKKKCATQSLLNRHLLTHRPTFTPEIKPPGSFTCNYCDKTFPSKLALSNHSRAHNFSRPYACHVCRKAFRYQDSLLKHLQLHPNDPISETSTTKELPCIYTIQVCRPSFAAINSDIVENQSYISEQAASEVLNSEALIDTVSDEANNSVCLSIPEKNTDDISLLELKSVEETYLSESILQDEILQSIDADTLCNVTVEKPSDMTTLPRRPFSITIDGNLCCNTSLSTDGDITPSIGLLPDTSELDISDVDVSDVPSHVLLPVAHPASMAELTQLTATLSSEETINEFDGITKEFML